MTARRSITDRMKWKALLDRYSIPCTKCRLRIKADQSIEWDHYWPLALDGPHGFEAIRPLHKECHALKSFGSKATSAGSDIHAIAKAKRIARGGKTKSGRKLQSRPFDKTRSKGFDGTVRER
jgi:hypothetical protein